ncbi:MAG: 5'-nucleotidase C-terminal domain-containing protein, partial [Proteobacteria bacterium]|nr:5'-nucleotidase C-terminal domain-containing protein [Pseudomonadota bacterium]
KDGAPVLLLHAGDIVAPSFLSRSYDGAQMIDVLNALDGAPAGFDARMFATFGNHEFDKRKLRDAVILADLVRQSGFTWLTANVDFAPGADGRPLVGGPKVAAHTMVKLGGIQVGLFGLTTDITVPDYVAAITDPIAEARRRTAVLRAGGAEVVIAVTHLTMAEDKAILAALEGAGPDLIIGGHEHTRQAWTSPGGRMVVKADADAVSATVTEVALDGDGPPRIAYRMVDLAGDAPAPDPAVLARVEDWVKRHDIAFCAEQSPPAPTGCLDAVEGRAAATLVAEELEIRGYETNFGDWIMDRALDAFRDAGAQAAVINAGSLRLNQNIAAGQPITRRMVEALFAFPTGLRLIEIDGATLRKVVDHAVTGWPGSGRWLQVAGLAFRHDPAAGTATGLVLLGPDGPRPVTAAARIKLVTGTYLLDRTGDQDGYATLGTKQIVPGSAEDRTLKSLVLDGLRAAGEAGIAPRLEGRICTTGRPGPCLAGPE